MTELIYNDGKWPASFVGAAYPHMVDQMVWEGSAQPGMPNHGRRGGGASVDDSGQCGRTGASNEIWNFGAASEAAIARVMHLREQLRPYVLEQYKAAAADGTPVMRPLFFDFWSDPGAQLVDDQLMFGPDYLVAPQLKENATERTVISIVEATPLIGDDFGVFPVYKRTKTPPPPPPPPPPPAMPPCSTCNVGVVGLDAAGHTLIGHFDSTVGPAECCTKCKAIANCDAYSYGSQDGGPLQCFLLSGVTGVKVAAGRTFGCVRPPCC
eukprot:gene3941-21372_t